VREFLLKPFWAIVSRWLTEGCNRLALKIAEPTCRARSWTTDDTAVQSSNFHLHKSQTLHEAHHIEPNRCIWDLDDSCDTFRLHLFAFQHFHREPSLWLPQVRNHIERGNINLGTHRIWREAFDTPSYIKSSDSPHILHNFTSRTLKYYATALSAYTQSEIGCQRNHQNGAWCSKI
jgi:hypothetical protein